MRLRVYVRALGYWLAAWCLLTSACHSGVKSDFKRNPKYEHEMQEQALDSVPAFDDSLK